MTELLLSLADAGNGEKKAPCIRVAFRPTATTIAVNYSSFGLGIVNADLD